MFLTFAFSSILKLYYFFDWGKQTFQWTHFSVSGVCDAGYGGDSCTICDSGTYKTLTGPSDCISCGTGKTTNSPGATAETQCKTYYYIEIFSVISIWPAITIFSL